MQPHIQDPHLLQPRVFDYSLDWRFLLPLAEPEGVCLLLAENERFNQTLAQVGIGDSQRRSLADLQHGRAGNFHSFVMPFGLPVGWTDSTSPAQVEFYSELRRLMSSDSYLLVGFNNIWALRANPGADYYACRPGQMAGQLQQAGFRNIKIFGAMPNLNIPEYIFDLEPHTVHYALRNRFRRKAAILRALGILAGTMGWRHVSTFLPCFFALAVA